MAFADAQDNAIITYGAEPTTVKLAGTVKKGDAIGFSDGWKRALATSGSVVQMRRVAGEDGASGQEITAYGGLVIIEGERFSGGTAGSALYVAEGSDNGEYTETAPTTSGDLTGILNPCVKYLAIVGFANILDIIIGPINIAPAPAAISGSPIAPAAATVTTALPWAN